MMMMRNSASAAAAEHHEHEQQPEAAAVLVSRLLRDMTITEKIGQMSQIDIGMLLQPTSDGRDKELNMTAVEEYIGKQAVGSVLNLVDTYWTAEKYRTAAMQIQTVAAKYQRPPVIWGLDSVHGANYIHGATVSPQPLNLAATFNQTAAHHAGWLASRDTRAAGINWLFSPLLGISLKPRWSRVFETFGEDPVVAGEMAAHMIAGIQQPDPNSKAVPSRAAACGKHFVGYSAPHNGHDRSPSWIPVRHLYQYFVPPWKRVLLTPKKEENDDQQQHLLQVPLTIMEDYTEIDGVPMVENHEMLNYLLRHRLQFTGVLVTDYEEFRNLHNWHHTAADDRTAYQDALRRGSVDMSMIPWDYTGFRQAILTGLQPPQHRLSQDRIDIAAQRVLQLKQTLHMMNDPVMTMDDPNLALIGTDEADMMSTVHQSIILTQNKQNLLPLDTTTTTAQKRLKVLVTGPTGASRVYTSGAWTGRWQGVPVEDESKWYTYGASVLGAFSAESAWDVSFRCGVTVLGQDCTDDHIIKKNTEEDDDDDAANQLIKLWNQAKDWVGVGGEDDDDDDDKSKLVPESIARAAQAAAASDVVVICIGEEASTEKPGDIRSLELPWEQYQLVQLIRQTAKTTKIVLVYFGGRPRLLRRMVEHVDAVFVGFLPGPSAGPALVDLVLGRANPSGRLPLTYPLYDDEGGVPYFHSVSDQCTAGDGPKPHYQYVQCPVQWPFGHGLSYTTFAYSDLTATGGIDQDLTVSVTVKNTGRRAGAETVLFFTFDDFRLTTPEYKRLRAFDKVYLEPGQQVVVTSTVSVDDLRFVGPDDDSHYILDPQMTSWLGVGAWTDCRAGNAAENDLCVRLQADNPNKDYVAACEAACNIWTSSGCGPHFGFSSTSPDTCLSMCTAISHYPSSAVEHGNQGWGWNYVRCLESVVPGLVVASENNHHKTKKECWKMTTLCRDIFHTGKLDEYGVGPPEGAGPSSGANNMPETTPVANFIALIVGLIASWMIVVLMKGGSLMPKRRPETEFTELNTREEEEEEIIA